VERLKLINRLVDRNSREREILRTLSKTGSLKETAQLLGLSYKTVWSYVTAINNAFGQKVVETRVGGEGGGRALLTDFGRELLAVLDDLSGSFERLLKLLNRRRINTKTLSKFSKRHTVRTSARNQIFGRVVGIKRGVVNALIEVETRVGEVITATLTVDSLEALGIEKGVEVYLLIKAPWVIIGLDETHLSAGNVFPATVKEVIKGAVNSEVVLETQKGTQLIAVVTNESAEKLNLEPGKPVKAIFSSSHVIVGV